MKLVILYWPPAVGKLSVAKELAKITGYKIFHNHLTMDIISFFFKFGTPRFWKENAKLREMIFKSLVKENINCIFTYAYSGKEDDKFIRNISKLVKKNKGEVYLVRLITSKKELEKRVKDKTRRKYGKLKDINGLRREIKNNNFFRIMPFEPQIEINNTNINSKRAAKIIKSFLN